VQETKHYWLYALHLHEGKYYIGTTAKKDPHVRIQEHMNGFYSAQWVKKYKPIEPVEIIDIGTITKEQAELLEQHRTLQYMKKYGYQNVRGGRLNYSGKYLVIGNRFVRDKDAEFIVTILVLLTIVALLVIV
jgi:predicted GIY-YIG superfamily endonuclease